MPARPPIGPAPPPRGADLERALPASVRPPAGHRLVTLDERPDLAAAMDTHNGAAWPEFMLHDPVADRLWAHLPTTFAGYQVGLLGPDGSIAAALNAAPLRWDGTVDGLPAGWDEQFERSVRDAAEGREPDTLGALQVVVARERQGEGLAALMVESMRALGRLRGSGRLIACVRPTLKAAYPLVAIDRYARWTRPDGLPFDPWIRLHVRLGGRIVRAAPASMRIEGSVAEWQAWTGMAFPESGESVVPGAAATVSIDAQADRGIYLDPNVWVVHDLARA